MKKLFASVNVRVVLALFAIGMMYAWLSGNDPFVWPSAENPINYAYMMFIAFCQNISFSMVSRARNRDSAAYHMVVSCFSNGVWFATFAYLVIFKLNWSLFIPYTCGTVAGSLTGTQISMFVEKLLGATSDSHVKKVPKQIDLIDSSTGEECIVRVANGQLQAWPKE